MFGKFSCMNEIHDLFNYFTVTAVYLNKKLDWKSHIKEKKCNLLNFLLQSYTKNITKLFN